MSCFVVEDECIDVIVTYLSRVPARNGEPPDGLAQRAAQDPQALGRELLGMNVEAYRQLYGKAEEEIAAQLAVYRFQPLPTDELQALKSMRCYLYQCSEGDVPGRELYRLVDAVSDELASKLAHEWERQPHSVWHARLAPWVLWAWIEAEALGRQATARLPEWIAREFVASPEDFARRLYALAGKEYCRPASRTIPLRVAHMATRDMLARGRAADPELYDQLKDLSARIAWKIVNQIPAYDDVAVWGGPSRVVERELFAPPRALVAAFERGR